MRHPELGLRALVALATALLVLLTTFSDFQPRSADRFADLPDGQTVRVQCEVSQVRQSQKGWMLEMLDFTGQSVSGFLANEAGPPPTERMVVEVQGTWSSGSDLFFVRRWAPI